MTSGPLRLVWTPADTRALAADLRRLAAGACPVAGCRALPDEPHIAGCPEAALDDDLDWED